jgi:hypothetical protein
LKIIRAEREPRGSLCFARIEFNRHRVQPGFDSLEEHEDMAKDRDGNKPQKPELASPQSEAPLKPAGEAVVKHEEAAAKPPEGKHIHRRRPLPLIPEKGAEQSSANQQEEGSAPPDE